MELTEFAKSVLEQEIAGIQQLLDLLDDSLDEAVQRVIGCEGHVVLTGVGKPWLIGQKISATLASTGTPSFALHPSEAMHGDLGRLRKQDVVIALSNSGTSEEIVRLMPIVRKIGCSIVAITAELESPLAQVADVVLNMGRSIEACPLGMAPSVSTTVMLALGDALALSVMKARNFSRSEYAQFHPGGALGRSLMKVSEVMRPLSEMAIVESGATVADALNAITSCKTGAAFVVQAGQLVGIFTDGDLRRHIQNDNLLEQPIQEVMTQGGHVVRQDEMASQAAHIVQNNRIGELPVVDAQGHLVGQVSLKGLVSMHFL